MVVSVAYFLSVKSENEFIVETKKDLEELSSVKDSTFILAEEVLKDVSEQKKVDSTKMVGLDEMVKKKQITIQQQVIELKKLVTESNKMKELAEREREKAIIFEMESNQQKMLAEEKRMEMKMALDSLILDNKRVLNLNKKLTREVGLLKNEISKLEKFISENVKKAYIEEGELNEELNKKKKRKGEK